MLNTAKVSKTIWTYNRVFLCQIHTSGFFTSFGKFFSIMAIPDVMKGGTPYMGMSPARLCTHLWEQDGTRDVFGCKGKITLFSFPKEHSVMWTVDAVCFFGSATEFRKCVCWRIFYKPGPVWCWICTWFDTERWSGPSYEISPSWFRTADGKWNSIKCLCFVGYRYSSAHHSLAPPTACLQELGFFQRES